MPRRFTFTVLSFVSFFTVFALPTLAAAQESTPAQEPARPIQETTPAITPHIDFRSLTAAPELQAQPRQVAFQYSDAYKTRLKIHKYASFATLPLFGAEAIIGQQLYTHPTQSKKSEHLVLATAIGGLFAVNTVTGVWNLMEGRKDPNRHTKVVVHSILMLAADAGFLATAMTGPGSHNLPEGVLPTGSGTHRAIAFTAISTAAVGYVIMLFGE